MSLDHRLIDLLVCPVCKGPLQLLRNDDLQATELLCPADRLAYPLRDGIPVMLQTEARNLDQAAPPSTDPQSARSPDFGA